MYLKYAPKLQTLIVKLGQYSQKLLSFFEISFASCSGVQSGTFEREIFEKIGIFHVENEEEKRWVFRRKHFRIQWHSSLESLFPAEFKYAGPILTRPNAASHGSVKYPVFRGFYKAMYAKTGGVYQQLFHSSCYNTK